MKQTNTQEKQSRGVSAENQFMKQTMQMIFDSNQVLKRRNKKIKVKDIENKAKLKSERNDIVSQEKISIVPKIKEDLSQTQKEAGELLVITRNQLSHRTSTDELMLKRIAQELPAYIQNNTERIESERKSQLGRNSPLARNSPLPNIDRRESQKNIHSKKSSANNRNFNNVFEKTKEIISAELLLKN